MRFLVFSFVVFVMISPAGASGVSISGGGHGVQIGKRVYLLDLVEKGIERTPDVVNLSPWWLAPERYWELTFQVPDLDTDLLQKKVSDVAVVDPVFAAAIQRTLMALSWSVVHVPLKPVDADSTLRVPISQVALRTYDHVQIDGRLWAKMDRVNRVALFLHEAISALAARELTAAPVARSLTANLFTSSYLLRAHEDTQNDLQFFPSVTKLASREIDGQRPFTTSSEILSTASDFSPLLWPDGRPTVSDPKAQIVLGTDFRLAPRLRLTWAPIVKGVVRREMAFIEDRFLKSEFVPASSHEIQACRAPAQDHKLLKVEAGFTRIEVANDGQLNGGNPWPRFIWKPVYYARAILSLNGAASTSLADCTPSDIKQLDALGRWLSLFKGPSRDEPDI